MIHLSLENHKQIFAAKCTFSLRRKDCVLWFFQPFWGHSAAQSDTAAIS